MAYNGWSNYETWNVKLWLDNDQGTYNYVLSEVRDFCRRSTDQDDAVEKLAAWLEEYIDDGIPEELAGTLYSDLLNRALSEVNYRELARAYVDDEWEEDLDEESTPMGVASPPTTSGRRTP